MCSKRLSWWVMLRMLLGMDKSKSVTNKSVHSDLLHFQFWFCFESFSVGLFVVDKSNQLLYSFLKFLMTSEEKRDASAICTKPNLEIKTFWWHLIGILISVSPLVCVSSRTKVTARWIKLDLSYYYLKPIHVHEGGGAVLCSLSRLGFVSCRSLGQIVGAPPTTQ